MNEETQASESNAAITGTEGLPGKDARTWGMACHLISLCGFILPFGGSILGPAILWFVKKNDDPFIDDQGKEAVNFQLTMLIAFIVSAVLILVIIGFFLCTAVVIYTIIMVIIAGMKAKEGVAYRYPYTIRFIK